MVDQVREIFQGAKWNRFFRGVRRFSITGCHVRNNDLRITFCSQGSGFEEGLTVPDTLAVDIHTGFNIVDCVDNDV
jgi:hypothetical protein